MHMTPRKCSAARWVEACPRRLFQDIRETRGLAYSIYAFHSAYRDTGAFGIYAGPDSEENAGARIHHARRAGACRGRFDEARFRRAKAQSKMALLSARRRRLRASFMARSLLAYGRVLSREELTGRIDRLVSVEEVARPAALCCERRWRWRRSGP